MQSIKTLAMKWPMQIFTNSLVQFECLILISAFSLAYYNIGKTAKEVIIFIAKKYLRFWFLISFLLIYIKITKEIEFEFQSHTNYCFNFVNNCFTACCADSGTAYGWLYIKSSGTVSGLRTMESSLYSKLFQFRQNGINHNTFDNPFEQFFWLKCLSNTWIFCVEMQLSIAFIPLIILMNQINDKTTKIFWLLLPLFCVIGFAINASIVYFYELPPNFFWTLPDPELVP